MQKTLPVLRLGSHFGITKQTEIILFAFIGILVTIIEASLLDLRSNMYKIWDVQMDPSKFSVRIQHYMRYLLSGVVLVRTFSVHLYLGCYIVLLYPAIFADRPALLLPWIVVNAVKNLLTAAVSLTAGVFTCLRYSFMQPTCWEFLLALIVDNSPSVYMFFMVISYYRDLKTMLLMAPYIKPTEQTRLRRKTRIDPDVTTVNNEDNDKITSLSTIDDIFHLTATLSRGTTRSLDTLLDQMREEEDEQIETLEGVSTLNVTEFTTKMLQLSTKDIHDAKLGRDRRVSEGKKGCKSMNSLYSFHRLKEKVNVIPKFVSEVIPMPSEVELKTVMPQRILSDVSLDSKSSRASYEMQVIDGTKRVEDNDVIFSTVEKDKTARRRTFTTLIKSKAPSANTSTSQIEGFLVKSVDHY